MSSYLFIPLYVAGIVFLALYVHPPYWFYIAGILMFIATFMKTDLLVSRNGFTVSNAFLSPPNIEVSSPFCANGTLPITGQDGDEP